MEGGVGRAADTCIFEAVWLCTASYRLAEGMVIDMWCAAAVCCEAYQSARY